MPSNTVAQFAIELTMPANVLLEQLRAAGIDIKSVDDGVTDADKAKLLESLRRSHGGSEGKKITLTRRQTSEIRQADGSGRSRTIPVERRKKRVFVKRDPAELLAEAARAAGEAENVNDQAATPAPTAAAAEPVAPVAPEASVPTPTSEPEVSTAPEAAPVRVRASEEPVSGQSSLAAQAAPAAGTSPADEAQDETPPVAEPQA